MYLIQWAIPFKVPLLVALKTCLFAWSRISSWLRNGGIIPWLRWLHCQLRHVMRHLPLRLRLHLLLRGEKLCLHLWHVGLCLCHRVGWLRLWHRPWWQMTTGCKRPRHLVLHISIPPALSVIVRPRHFVLHISIPPSRSVIARPPRINKIILLETFPFFIQNCFLIFRRDLL